MIALGIIASFLSDFLFQTKKIINLKERNIVYGNFIHSLFVLVITLFTFLYVLIDLFLSRNIKYVFGLLAIMIIITIIHFLLDCFKSWAIKKEENPIHDLILFVIDQLLHVTSIIIIFSLAEAELKYRISDKIYIIPILLGVIFIGDHLIRKVFKVIKLKNYDKREEEIKGVGSVIGKIERAIMLIALVSGFMEIAIAVIGIKSIARFPEFNKNEEKTNDYFILGNLLSLLMVVIGLGIYQLILKY